MKKQIAFIALMLASLLCLVSCAENVPDIGSYVWRMESAQSASQNGDISAAAPDAQTNCNTIVELKLTAKNGVLTLTDAKENTVYTGTYKLSQKNLRDYPKGNGAPKQWKGVRRNILSVYRYEWI